jgi:cyanophycinase
MATGERHNGRQGSLIIIGGHEDKERDRTILREIVKRLDGGRLVVATVASEEPEGYFESYKRAFSALGVRDIVELYVRKRGDALDPGHVEMLDGAGGVFFTGGDQLRIASHIGESPIQNRISEIHARGGVIAGTSAGASAMSETMLVKGTSSDSSRLGDLKMAPGLGLIKNVIIDQHFIERGRFGRLLAAVAQNPRVLGIGIDEDTSIIVEGDAFVVRGSGAVYAIDASEVTYSNISKAKPELTLSVHGVRLHVLGEEDEFDLEKRRPSPPRSVS